MSTQRTANVQIINETDGNAWIVLYHSNSSNGMQVGGWNAGPSQTVGTLQVFFETGVGTEGIEDYWCVMIHVQGGSTPGFYINSGSLTMQYWKECQLQHEDADETLTFTVSASSFKATLASGGCDPEGMTKLAPAAPITHVFVLMLENHSFDNVFAMSGIPNITAATTSNSNSYNAQQYLVQPAAPTSMPTNPSHECPDIVEQLAGAGATYPSGGPYPAINNSGFAASYATSTTEGPAPATEDIGDIMACFATPIQLPLLYALALHYAICDQWHASLPGPTWPNRFFVHGASSSGLDASPTTGQIAGWELPGQGFEYGNGSIYQRLGEAGINYRFYNDSVGAPTYWSIFSDDPSAGNPVGAVPQVTSLSGVTLLDFNSLQDFKTDLMKPYPYPYTFIEPHYGDVTSGTYAGGSSHHPMDDVYGCENLVATVFAAIQGSPFWSSSLLIILYDEHGGFYDSVLPGSAVPPGDKPPSNYNVHGFTFDQYGVRVPAIIASPLIPPGTVDHTLYDHSSVLATLEKLYGLLPLTNRDANANDLLHLIEGNSVRTDVVTLASPAPPRMTPKPKMTADEQARIDAQPIPEKGNLPGALLIMGKTEMELSAGTPAEIAAIKAKVAAIKTRGQARAYIASVMEKVGIAKEQRKAASAQKPS